MSSPHDLEATKSAIFENHNEKLPHATTNDEKEAELR